jgi:hypothetical protein
MNDWDLEDVFWDIRTADDTIAGDNNRRQSYALLAIAKMLFNQERKKVEKQ